MIKMIGNKQRKYKISFYTLVTNMFEYNEMVLSAQKNGFDRDDVIFYYFDNISENLYDGYNAINEAINSADSEYIVVCHQDILFKFNGYETLIEKIEEIKKIDPKWAILGNAGKNERGEYFIDITDPNGRQKIGPFPSKVMSLDENFLVINSRVNIGCTNILKGFHFYGTDLCQNANYLGYNNFVIDFHLYHKSSGNLNNDFFESKKNYISLQRDRKKSRIIYTACTKIYCSNRLLLNFIFNIRFMNKIYRFFKGLC